MLPTLGAGGVTLMVSEQGLVTIGHDLSLASHIVADEHVHNGMIYAKFVCKCEFYMNLSAFS